MDLSNTQRVIGLRGLKSQIEALTATILEEYSLAVSTDTGNKQLGVYAQGAWQWFSADTSTPGITVEDVDGNTFSSITDIVFSGATVLNNGANSVLVTIATNLNIPSHTYNEDLTSQVSGYIFTTSRVYESGTLRVYYNGLRQRKGVHYLDDVEFTTFSTYFPTTSGDVIVVDYDYLDSSQISYIMDSDGFTLVDSDGSLIGE
jgi:hypothetical protein